MVRIPVGGGVDDDLDAFVFVGGTGDPSILRTKIDTGRGGEAPLFQRGELGGVIGREKDVVMRQIEA
jgi:hypothetical protein